MTVKERVAEITAAQEKVRSIIKEMQSKYAVWPQIRENMFDLVINIGALQNDDDEDDESGTLTIASATEDEIMRAAQEALAATPKQEPKVRHIATLREYRVTMLDFVNEEVGVVVDEERATQDSFKFSEVEFLWPILSK